MNPPFNPDLDLSISRIIKAPRAAVWDAWTIPARFEQWWAPAPARCKVLSLELRPGGAMRTQISEGGAAFTPHMDACFLAVDPMERIVFTNALVAGWRPAAQPLMSAIITLKDHPEGVAYAAHVMHKDRADRDMHEEAGFYDGWGTVTEQLAMLAERG